MNSSNNNTKNIEKEYFSNLNFEKNTSNLVLRDSNLNNLEHQIEDENDNTLNNRDSDNSFCSCKQRFENFSYLDIDFIK
jgi:hypothetical protein